MRVGVNNSDLGYLPDRYMIYYLFCGSPMLLVVEAHYTSYLSVLMSSEVYILVSYVSIICAYWFVIGSGVE